MIGDPVTVAPGAPCNGTLAIEGHPRLGSRAAIQQNGLGTPFAIGWSGAVGVQAVILNGVPTGATVVSNPARAPVTTAGFLRVFRMCPHRCGRERSRVAERPGWEPRRAAWLAMRRFIKEAVTDRGP